MKKLLLTLSCVALLGTGTVYSHCGSCGTSDKAHKMDKKKDKKMAKMVKKLGLSAEQEAKFKAAVDKKHEKKKAIKEEKRAKMKTVKEEFKAELATFLSADQIKKLEDHWAKKKGKKGKKKGKHHKDCDGESCEACSHKH